MILIKYKKKVNEDSVDSSVSSDSSRNNEEAIKSLNLQYVQKEEEKRRAETDYENKVRNIEQQKIAIKQQIAKLGGDVTQLESVTPAFYKKLFEAVTNKTDEIYALISLTFDSMDDISYRPSDTRCKTYAKNIIAFLNKNNYEQETAEQAINDYLMQLLNNSQVSLSNKEKITFVSKLIENMKESNLFSWYFDSKN